MKILIETIPHINQRYETVGDWTWDRASNLGLETGFADADERVLHIKVSKLGDDWRYEALVAIHEMVEALVCQSKGISQSIVDAFDTYWLNIPPQLRGVAREPGEAFDCPYHLQHMFAEYIERLCAAQLSVNWEFYSDRIDDL